MRIVCNISSHSFLVVRFDGFLLDVCVCVVSTCFALSPCFLRVLGQRAEQRVWFQAMGAEVSTDNGARRDPDRAPTREEFEASKAAFPRMDGLCEHIFFFSYIITAYI